MAQTLDGQRLKDVRIYGVSLPTALADNCVSASISASVSQITQMEFSFVDTMASTLFRSQLLAPGNPIDYGGWQLAIDGVTNGPGPMGPQLGVSAMSRSVHRWQTQAGQVGAKSWGTWDVSAFMTSVAKSNAMVPKVQPGLGTKLITRAGPTAAQPDVAPENSWDVFVRLAAEAGAWIFEVRNTLYFGKPSWIAANPFHRIPLVYNSWNDYSEVLSSQPAFTDAKLAKDQKLQVGLISPDADEAVPGDVVTLSGAAAGRMGGTWIVESVAYPMSVAGPVQLSCVRVSDPTPQKAATPAPTTSALGVGAINWAAGNFTGGSYVQSSQIQWPSYYKSGSGFDFIMGLFGGIQAANTPQTDAAGRVVAGKASVDQFVAKYIGKAIDWDGVYGAQCVDLSAYYFWEVCGVQPATGNGKDIFYNQNAGVSKVGANSPGRPGDIACWGSSMGGGYGHVALVLADMGHTLATMSQNPGPCHYQNITKVGLQGYCRPLRAL